MAKLPDRSDLGVRLPGAARGMPSFPTSSPIASALLGLGETGQRVGFGMMQERQKEIEREEEFGVQTRYIQFDAAQREWATQRALSAPPGAAGFVESLAPDGNKAAQEFLKTVPERLRAGYALKITETATDVQSAASKFQRAEAERYKIATASDAEELLLQRQTDPNTPWESVRADGEKVWATSGLPAPVVDEKLREWRQRHAAALFEQRQALDPVGARSQLGVAGATDATGIAAGILREREGFRETAYWDVNAQRVGYGSDTVTRADGSIERVGKDTVVSREDAERDLARRIKEFAGAAERQIGPSWASLSPATRGALTSVAYNYGTIPNRIVPAVRSGDPGAIAQAIESLGGDNDGVNRDRRKYEADVVRSGGAGVAVEGSSPAPEYADLPYETRQKLYDSALLAEQKAAEEALKVAEAEKKAARAAYKESLDLQILRGEIRDEAAILNDPDIDDGDKATLIRSFRAQNEKVQQVQADVVALGTGSLRLNPLDSEERKRGDAVYEELVSRVADEDQKRAFTGAFIEETGIVPKAVFNGVRQRLASDDPEQVAAALVESANIQERAPLAISSMDNGSEIKDAATTFTHFVDDLGLSTEEAAQRVIQMRSPEFQRTAAALETVYKAMVDPTKGILSETDLAPAGWITSTSAGFAPDLISVMMEDYREIARLKLMGPARGDPELAKALALAEMKELYSVTEISGTPTVMKYPPERHYPPVNGSHDYLREEAMADAKAAAGDAEIAGIFIQSTPQTAADIRAKRLPRYRLYYATEENGQTVYHEVLGGGFGLTAEAIKAKTAPVEAAERERRAVERQENRDWAEALEDADRFGIDPLTGIPRNRTQMVPDREPPETAPVPRRPFRPIRNPRGYGAQIEGR